LDLQIFVLGAQNVDEAGRLRAALRGLARTLRLCEATPQLVQLALGARLGLCAQWRRGVSYFCSRQRVLRP